MKFGDVIIRNFLAIGEGKLNLTDVGLANIAGESDETAADSNGAGKSSIADAVNWCAWGTTARDVTGDDVVNTFAGKDTMVHLPVHDDGVDYRIERYRKHKTHKDNLRLLRIEDDGSETDLTKGTNKATQAQVERLLGCSEDVFKAAVYSGQEQMPDIPSMTDKQLKLLVEQAAGVDVLARAFEIAKARALVTSRTMSDKQVGYDRAVERHADLLGQLQHSSDQHAAWDQAQGGKIAALKARTVAAAADFKKTQSELDPVSHKELIDTIAATETRIQSVNVEVARERELSGDVSQAQAATATVASRVDQAMQAVAAAQRALSTVDSRVGTPCGSCGKEYCTEDIADAKTRAIDLVAKESVTLADLEKRKVALEGLAIKATASLMQHRASMTDVSAEAAQLRNLQRELQIVVAQKNEVERLRATARSIGEEWKRETVAINPFIAAIARQEAEIQERAAKIEEARLSLIDAREKDQYAQAAAETFAPAGVRAHRLDEATPYLNDRTAHYLGTLSDGKIEAYWTTLTENKAKTQLQERFSVTVEKAGSAPTFNNLSGGEKRKVRLACALALQDLVATRASKSIDLFIGDEIDDALDAAGLERLMGLLEEKAKERGTVLCISHNDIAAYVRKTILVTKKNDVSTVSAT